MSSADSFFKQIGPRPDLDPICLTDGSPERIFSKKLILKKSPKSWFWKNQQRTKKWGKFPWGQRVNVSCELSAHLIYHFSSLSDETSSRGPHLHMTLALGGMLNAHTHTYYNYSSSISPCHAKYFYVPHSFPNFILLTCSIPFLSICYSVKTVRILIRWLCLNGHLLTHFGSKYCKQWSCLIRVNNVCFHDECSLE